jgi:hypothetical protein
MAKTIIKDPIVVLNNGTVSASVAQVTVALEAADVSTTNFGSGGFEERIGGLKSGEVSIDFHQDYGSGGIDSVIYPLLGETVTVEVIPTAGTAVSATNPRFSFSAMVQSYEPIQGAVGDLATTSVSWPITGAITRGTA